MFSNVKIITQIKNKNQGILAIIWNHYFKGRSSKDALKYYMYTHTHTHTHTHTTHTRCEECCHLSSSSARVSPLPCWQNSTSYSKDAP